jgi:signal transduction histidine kinase
LFVLILEDYLPDFELVVRELHRAGFTTRCERAETQDQYRALLEQEPDIILADYVLAGGFSAMGALKMLRALGLDVPFIVLTGVVSEATILECMKLGAADYLLKDRLTRLGPAISGALEGRELRRDKQKAEQALKQKNIELEQQNRQLQEASRMKSTFLANMSHELRTPLNAIIGFSELILDGKAGPVSPDQLDFLQDILLSARHLLSLINGVLDLVKVESGTLAFHPERIVVSEIVGEVVSGLRPLAVQKHIALSADAHVGEVFLDRQKLKQVLFNYLSNALKFTPEGGRISVRASAEPLSEDGDASLRLEVEDTGIGIEEHDISRLFEDFHQVDNSLGKQFTGTGLGLALTRRLVEAQGGRVGVTSEPGKGSTFVAVLPTAIIAMETVGVAT